jgi:hypothetical protein
MFGERAHVRLDPGVDRGADHLSALLRAEGIAVESVRPIAASLEDVFIARLDEARS